MSLLAKLKGDGAVLPPQPSLKSAALAWVGGFLAAFGPHWWSAAPAVGTSIAAIMLRRTAHPPTGSNPVILYLTQPGWSFLLFPTLVGAIVIVAVALIYNNATREGAYPRYW